MSTLAQLHCLVLERIVEIGLGVWLTACPEVWLTILRGDNGIIIISRRTMTPREIMPDLTWKNVQRIHVIRIG